MSQNLFYLKYQSNAKAVFHMYKQHLGLGDRGDFYMCGMVLGLVHYVE